MDSTSDPSPRLGQNSRIAIIGGGPAGSFFALSALDQASQRGLTLQISIFERKDLTAAGPRGCNMCAGILSRRVIEGLGKLGITLPPSVIMGRVRRYQMHWGGQSVSIDPPDTSRQVLSVYRAGGPRRSPYAPTDGLDNFLLMQAQARGARVFHERVEEVRLGQNISVKTSRREEAFDLVVLATGVNASPPILHSLDYVRPATEAMAQDSLLVESDAGRAEMASTVHIYFDQPRDLLFGALIPKGNFAGVSLLGRQLRRTSLEDFLRLPEVKNVAGNHAPQMCGCRPRVAVGPARGYYADRFVAVGDACVTRLYKDGIGSALVTASAAAKTALVHGIGASEFAAHYAPVCRAVEWDNRAGRLVFFLVGIVKANRLLMRAFGEVVKSEKAQAPGARVLGRTLWALFTGDSDYTEILRMMLMPRTVALLCQAFLRQAVRRLQRESADRGMSVSNSED
jgi:flavin-dependent dehydrogenase